MPPTATSEWPKLVAVAIACSGKFSFSTSHVCVVVALLHVSGEGTLEGVWSTAQCHKSRGAVRVYPSLCITTEWHRRMPSMPAESTSKAEGSESVQNDTSKIKSLTQINLWPRFGCVGLFTGHALGALEGAKWACFIHVRCD